MVKGYKEFLLLLERNNINKIKKFANVPEIYNWAHEKDNNLSTWLADQLVKLVRKGGNEIFKKFFDLWIKDNLTVETAKQVNTIKENRPDISDKDLQLMIDNFIEDFKAEITKLKDRHDRQFTKVLHYVNSPIHDNRPNIRNLDLGAALQISEEWHKEMEKRAGGVIEDEEGEVILTFPDGFYWIDLQSTTCKKEAEAMGHCGNTNEGTTILSLRKNKYPHVTVAYDEHSDIFTQIKGKGNTKPVDKYHTYIVDLIIHLEVEGFKSEHQRTTDFLPEDLSPELYDKLEQARPDYIENSKGLTVEEMREKYYDDIMNNLEYETRMNGHIFFNHVDDDKFIEGTIENEINQSSIEDMKHYYNDEDELSELKELIIDNVDEEKLRKLINKYITDDLENEEERAKLSKEDIKELEKKLKENTEETIDDLMTIEDWDSKGSLFILIGEFNLENDLYTHYWEGRYGDMDAQDYYESLYGTFNGELETGFLSTVQYENAFDEEGFAEELSEDADDDYLNDRYN